MNYNYHRVNYDPPIQRYKTVLMQRIQKSLSSGYYYHFSGRISYRKAESLAAKFAEKYKVHVGQTQRYRNKQSGKASAYLYLFPIPESTDFWWIVMLTEGEHPARTSESLSDARHKRCRIRLWDNSYQAIRRPRDDGKSAWTWEMTKTHYESWKSRLKSAIQNKNTQKISETLNSLGRVPGYAGLRINCKALLKYGYKLYNSAYRNNGGNPFKRRLVPWIKGSLPNSVYPLSALIIRKKRGCKRWYPAPETTQ